MSRDDYESERTADRTEIAAALGGVADGLIAGTIQLGEGSEAVIVAPPEELTFEVELETEDDEVSLELELEWPLSAEGDVETRDETEPADDRAAPVGAATGAEGLARFEVYLDKGGEWRWRLRHRNGNIIATSGEGYTRKHNAWKGLESVMRNAPDAEVCENARD